MATRASAVSTSAVLFTLAMTLAACAASEPGASSATLDASASAAEVATEAAGPAPLGSEEGDLEPGTHVLDLVALDQAGTGPEHLPLIEITVPAGWSNSGGWAVRKAGPFTVALTFWDVGQVYPTPCQWADEPMIDPGASVDGLAAALADVPLRDATPPTDVELGGYRGKYLEWSVPADIDFEDCDEGYFESFTGNGWSSDRYQQAPGQVDRLWILDVAGERLVVDASYMPSATAEERAELDQIVESIRFLD